MIGLTQDMDVVGLFEIGEHVSALCSRGFFGHVLITEDIDEILFFVSMRGTIID